ncbi:hypothetical protein [Actinosynnema sp. NPDC020468]|uniref:hypothetical protein n=1 Tax=Actinosynnema sp. NPDC020468 TaxID=3154488 RepID=UPI0033C54DC9
MGDAEDGIGPDDLLRLLLHARRALGHAVDAPPGPHPFTGPAAVWPWFAHRLDAVAVAVERAGEGEGAAVLLGHLWAVVPPDADEAWCLRLRDRGVVLAGHLPGSAALAEAFRRSAGVFRARGAFRSAELEAMREWEIRDRLGEPRALLDALRWLTALFRDRGRTNRVIDCADQYLKVHLRQDHRLGAAGSLAYLGSLMLETGRPDAAADYADRADRAYREVPDAPADLVAANRELWGRALWAAGQQSAARRQFRRAAEGLSGSRADRTRALLDVVGDLPPPVTPVVEPVGPHLDVT